MLPRRKTNLKCRLLITFTRYYKLWMIGQVQDPTFPFPIHRVASLFRSHHETATVTAAACTRRCVCVGVVVVPAKPPTVARWNVGRRSTISPSSSVSIIIVSLPSFVASIERKCCWMTFDCVNFVVEECSVIWSVEVRRNALQHPSLRVSSDLTKWSYGLWVRMTQTKRHFECVSVKRLGHNSVPLTRTSETEISFVFILFLVWRDLWCHSADMRRLDGVLMLCPWRHPRWEIIPEFYPVIKFDQICLLPRVICLPTFNVNIVLLTLDAKARNQLRKISDWNDYFYGSSSFANRFHFAA